MDRRQDAVEQRAADRDFGELESDGPGMSNNSGTNLDQPGLKAGQRPIGHLFGQISALSAWPEFASTQRNLDGYGAIAAISRALNA